MEESTIKVRNALEKQGIKLEVLEFDASTRTAQMAADALECELNQITKSIILKAEDSEAILVLTAGGNRVDMEVVAEKLGKKVKLADPEFVFEKSGFKVGGVSPVGLKEDIMTFIDSTLIGYEDIYPAAGTAHACFKITSKKLQEITGAKIIEF